MAIPKNVIFTDEVSKKLADLVVQGHYDKVGLLVDENTKKHCLPLLETEGWFVIEIESGEKNKQLQTCISIWEELTLLQFTRRSLLINLGGGVITDMGGFVAATYKRGIAFINVPTTLLAQVDASIGGKIGVDFQQLKNHIGLFQEPLAVFLDTLFLKTLPGEQLRSGYAEILKHGLIADAEYWKQLKAQNLEEIEDWRSLLRRSVAIKGEVVASDPFEKGKRKILNFGHTLGHAIETHFLDSTTPLLHGEAVAIGMILESFLSSKIAGLANEIVNEIAQVIVNNYPHHALTDYQEISHHLLHDKKNDQGRINYSLLSSIGQCQWDQQVPESMIKDALAFYHSLYE